MADRIAERFRAAGLETSFERARTSVGRVRLATRRRVVCDLRGTDRRAARLKVSARTSSGRLVKQKRTYPACAIAASLRRAVGGMEE